MAVTIGLGVIVGLVVDVIELILGILGLGTLGEIGLIGVMLGVRGLDLGGIICTGVTGVTIGRLEMIVGCTIT